MGTPVKPKYIVAEGKIRGLYQTDTVGFETKPVNTMSFSLEGIVGETRQGRTGLTMPADVRTRGVPKGRKMRHRQQISILGLSEVERLIDVLDTEHGIIDNLGDADPVDIVAQAFGANILWACPERVSDIPNGSRITVLDDNGMAENWSPILEVARYNPPCINPAKALAEVIYAEESPDLKQAKVSALAKEILKHVALSRGIVASVESASYTPNTGDEQDGFKGGLGVLCVRDKLTAFTLQQTSDDSH